MNSEYYKRIDEDVEFYRLNAETGDFTRMILPGDGYTCLKDVTLTRDGQLTVVRGFRVTPSNQLKRFWWYGRDWTEL